MGAGHGRWGMAGFAQGPRKVDRPQAQGRRRLFPGKLSGSRPAPGTDRGTRMKIGIIGAGTVAQTIARHVLPLGHQVMLSNTRGPESLAPLVKQLGPGASAGTPQQAAGHEIVVLAVLWSDVRAALLSIPTGRDAS